jgi:hypothetical protein
MFKNDPMCIEHVVSIMFEQDAPIRKESGFAYTVPCRARHAGLVIRQPLTCSIRKQPPAQGNLFNIDTNNLKQNKSDKIKDDKENS